MSAGPDDKMPKYAIEFIDSATSDSEMYDGYNILLIEGKTALSIANCWDPVVADRILAGFEMLDMLDSGVIPGVPARKLTAATKSSSKRATAK